MKHSVKAFLVNSLAVGVLTQAAVAQITYVDASFNANTYLALSAGGGSVATNGTDTADGIWRYRTGFGLSLTDTALPAGTILTGGSGTVYEGTGNSNPSDNVPRVVTTVGGLSLNTYDVYVYFWSDQNNSPWQIRAGLSDTVDPLSLFIGGAVPAGTPTPLLAGHDNATGGTGNGRLLWQAMLGQVTGTSISVFVEDAPATSGIQRTWYDGIGYAVPEPSSLTLLGCAVVLLFVRRKQSRK